MKYKSRERDIGRIGQMEAKEGGQEGDAKGKKHGVLVVKEMCLH